MAINTIVNCPHCSKSVEWIESSTWRPFCCERCKMIDLGAWASEDYNIAGRDASSMDDIDYSGINSEINSEIKKN